MDLATTTDRSPPVLQVNVLLTHPHVTPHLVPLMQGGRLHLHALHLSKNWLFKVRGTPLRRMQLSLTTAKKENGRSHNKKNRVAEENQQSTNHALHS